jgi:hypothetical protein
MYNGHTKDEFVVQRTTAFVDQVSRQRMTGLATLR